MSSPRVYHAMTAMFKSANVMKTDIEQRPRSLGVTGRDLGSERPQLVDAGLPLREGRQWQPSRQAASTDRQSWLSELSTAELFELNARPSTGGAVAVAREHFMSGTPMQRNPTSFNFARQSIYFGFPADFGKIRLSRNGERAHGLCPMRVV
jgi:hypothetical protein